MKYLLYLWRSFAGSPRRHLTLSIILTCAFLLPLAISIYRDSSAYGDRQSLIHSSKGASFHIGNASEEYVPFFQDIPGLSQPSCEDGTICLTILSEEEWKAEKKSGYYAQKLFEQMDRIGDEKLTLRGWSFEQAHGISTDPFDAYSQNVLFAFNLFLILLSVFVIQSAYKTHLKRFAPDMGILISCGAGKSQIRGIFIVEFILIFSLASLSALLISVGILKLLFRFFLTVQVEGLAWLLFHVDPWNTLLHFLIYFTFSAATLGITLWQTSRKSTWTLLHQDPAVSEKKQILKQCKKEISARSSPVASLSNIWRRRTNGCFLNCLSVFIPIMAVFLFLFNYLIHDIEYVSAPPEYELLFDKLAFPPYNGFSEEEIALVKEMEGIRLVVPESTVRTYAVAPETGDPFETVEPFEAMEPPDVFTIDRLNLRLEQPELHGQVSERLRELFPGDEYQIKNMQISVDCTEQTLSKGSLLLLLYLFCMLFLFVLLILYAKLSDYIESCRGFIRSLYVLGASRKVLYRSCLRRSLPAAAAAAVAPLVVGEFLSWLYISSLGYSLVINGGVIAVYLVVAALGAGVFLSPVHRTMKKMLREF